MADSQLLAAKAKAKEVEPAWEVGTTEDVVQALLETLVDPLLPLRLSNGHPSDDAQKSVAKQMHAVVLLYNYYHRKQKLDLIFLNFVSFCKVAMVLRPPLTAFMKLMMEGESVELNDAENQLSITEKAIMEACDIAVALNASRDFPNTEGWPISKVAVLLIDLNKENCMLRFGGVTEGVWSLIEKEIYECSINNPEQLSEEKVGNKRMRSDQNNSTHETDEYLQLGFDAVKEITGIDSSDVEVLESHVTYSLSKEKSATIFYMIQCPGSFSLKEQIPLEFLVKSLHGPLAEKVDYTFLKTTPVIEFYHMLPYVELVSCWLSRKDLFMPSSNGFDGPSTTKTNENVLTQSSTPELSFSKYIDDLDHIDNISTAKKVKSSEEIDNENCDGNNECKHSSSSNVGSPIRINLEISDIDGGDQQLGLASGLSRGLFQQTVIDDDVIEKLNTDHAIAHSPINEDIGIHPEILDKDGVEGGKEPLSDSLKGPETVNMSNLTKDCIKSEDKSKMLNSKLRVYHHRRKNKSSTQNDAHVREDGASLRKEGVEMTPSPLIAVKKVEATWEVGPTEDVVQALMETLVDPFLPLRVCNVIPPEDAQKSVAKQIHAVVLLYNYHHRKQKPDLVFLNFLRFCKLAMVVRPPLTAFMKLMMEGESIELNDAENQLSITEKAIMEACDIAVALDASRDFPNTGGWPISKVAVLLIDSNKENCMLRFGGVTEGVWSLMEKEINECSINNQELLSEEKVGNKRKQSDQINSTYDTGELLQLGLDAVKDITGIDSSDLEVLESHATYSSSKEKARTLFYMVQCPESFSSKEQIPLEFLVKSLHGPLAEKGDYSLWKTTPVVEFHHMLPYVEHISCWLSRKDLSLPRLNSCNDQSNRKSRKTEPNQSSTLDLPLSKCNGDDLNHIDNISPAKKVESSAKIDIENCNSNDKRKDCNVASPSRVPSGMAVIDAENCDSNNMGKDCNVASPPRGSSAKTVMEDSVIEKFNTNHDHVHSPTESAECEKDPLSCPSREVVPMKAKTCTKSEDASKKLSSKHKVFHHKRQNSSSTQNDSHVREDGTDLRVDMADSLMLYHTLSADEKVSEEKGDVNQGGVAAEGNQLVLFEAKTKYSTDIPSASPSEDVENALALLYGKRRELYSQICNMEDTLAVCEDIISRIRDGGDVGLAREYLKSILSGNHHMLLGQGTQKDEKHRQNGTEDCRCLPEIYLPGKSSCQDLEYVCLVNNWRVPRYLIESSADGKFISNVVVQAKDFKLHSNGGFESKPCEARESAAAKMMAIIRDSKEKSS